MDPGENFSRLAQVFSSPQALARLAEAKVSFERHRARHAPPEHAQAGQLPSFHSLVANLAPSPPSHVPDPASPPKRLILRFRRPLPVLSTEIIEYILLHAFLPSSPLVPSSDPHHLRGTSHILLASRTIHDLALPFFYHTVVISRSSHYTHFFDPDHGLFTAGEQAAKRWSLVRELGIVLGIEPPVNPHYDADASSFLFPLAVPETPGRLLALTFLHRVLTRDETDDEPAMRALIRGAEENEWSRRDRKWELEGEFPADEYPRGSGGIRRWVQDEYHHDLETELDVRSRDFTLMSVDASRAEFLLETLLPSTQPEEIRWPFERFELIRGEAFPEQSDATLVLYPAAEPAWTGCGTFVHDVVLGAEQKFQVERIVMKGYNREVLQKMFGGDGGMESMASFPSLWQGSRAKWEWEREDGSVMGIVDKRGHRSPLPPNLHYLSDSSSLGDNSGSLTSDDETDSLDDD